MDHEHTGKTAAEEDPQAASADRAMSETNAGEGAPPVSRRRWIAGAAAALGVALFAVPLLRGPDMPGVDGSSEPDAADSRTCAVSKGNANFDFVLKDINGEDVRLSDYKGKVILLNFWATWCGPCKIEIPEFVETYNEYRDRGFVILGVLSQDDPSADDLRAFANDWGMTYPILREHDELDEAFGTIWAIPTSFIIDRQGAICTKHMGPVPKETLEREIKRLL